MNIFNSLRVYAGKWMIKSSRAFTEEEINAVKAAVIVPSQYGNSVCFMMVRGGQTYIPLANDATVGVGESIDLTKAKLLTLWKEGELDINRVSI